MLEGHFSDVQIPITLHLKMLGFYKKLKKNRALGLISITGRKKEKKNQPIRVFIF